MAHHLPLSQTERTQLEAQMQGILALSDAEFEAQIVEETKGMTEREAKMHRAYSEAYRASGKAGDDIQTTCDKAADAFEDAGGY